MKRNWYHKCVRKKYKPYPWILCSLCQKRKLDVLLTKEEADELNRKLKLEK